MYLVKRFLAPSSSGLTLRVAKNEGDEIKKHFLEKVSILGVCLLAKSGTEEGYPWLSAYWAGVKGKHLRNLDCERLWLLVWRKVKS